MRYLHSYTLGGDAGAASPPPRIAFLFYEKLGYLRVKEERLPDIMLIDYEKRIG
jgi:hypothetical protein